MDPIVFAVLLDDPHLGLQAGRVFRVDGQRIIGPDHIAHFNAGHLAGLIADGVITPLAAADLARLRGYPVERLRSA